MFSENRLVVLVVLAAVTSPEALTQVAAAHPRPALRGCVAPPPCRRKSLFM